MLTLLVLLACKDRDLDTGLYLNPDALDQSCQVFEGDALLACHDGSAACHEAEGEVTVRVEDGGCPDGATASCDDDHFYAELTDSSWVTWCNACAERPEGCPVDADLDGYGESDDCDDQDPGVHPGAEELCDGVDQDCDGTPDQDLSVENGACVEGALVCDSGFGELDGACSAYRTDWLGDYAYEVMCEELFTGTGALVEGDTPDVVVFESEEAPFTATLTSFTEATTDFDGTLTRDPESGVLTLDWDCPGTLTPQ